MVLWCLYVGYYSIITAIYAILAVKINMQENSWNSIHLLQRCHVGFFLGIDVALMGAFIRIQIGSSEKLLHFVRK